MCDQSPGQRRKLPQFSFSLGLGLKKYMFFYKSVLKVEKKIHKLMKEADNIELDTIIRFE